MHTALPVPIEFAVPEGWRAPHPEEAGASSGAVVAVHSGTTGDVTSNITVSCELRSDDAQLVDIADESVAGLRESGAAVEVLTRTEVGTSDSPGFTQILDITDARNAAEGRVRCQVFLAMPDITGNSNRAVLQLALTTTRAQVSGLADDFQRFLGSVRPVSEHADHPNAEPGAAEGEFTPAATPVPRHTRAAAPDKHDRSGTRSQRESEE
ncbi:hypothetical protein SAMN05216266_10911 [Amycolatopsis marina]|uniref:Lipoprotein LpqN n=1 Tax=Amycolatopsis marina TaxID=490629 RepID=A0A1I1ACT8_9PSEU|nr:hypothetical protein [Amycolatopsis marina]SFB35804.1 hypothetical protein SAMN05216266_10911 [Amycolatopsis marina]